MPLKPYALLIFSLILLASCKKLTREAVNLHIQTDDTFVGCTYEGDFNTRFANFDEQGILEAATARLGNEVKGRKITLVDRPGDADYVLLVETVTLHDRTIENIYTDGCSPSGYEQVLLNQTTLSVAGKLHNRAADVATAWRYGEYYADKVTDCYNDEERCTHYVVSDLSKDQVLKRYGKKAAKSLEKAIWADQDAH